MRKLLSAILLLSVMAFSCTVSEEEKEVVKEAEPELTQADREEIINTFMATKDAWNEGDLVEFMKGYHKSDDIVFSGASGPVYGYEATLERYQKGYPDLAAMGKLDFEVMKLYKIDNRTAIMIGQFYLTLEAGDQKGYYTLIWQKTDGEWLIISDHSSGGPVME